MSIADLCGVARSHLDRHLAVLAELRLLPVNLALANSKAATAALAGPSHNSAVKGSIRNKHTSGLFGPPGHHTSSAFRQATFVLSASRMTRARPVIDR